MKPYQWENSQNKSKHADIETFAKTIPIVAMYIVLVEKELFLNKKSTNHTKTNIESHTTTSGLYRDVFPNFD
jgi:hypothetical protein